MVGERRRGTRWIPDRLAELKEAHRPAAVICDGIGPAASLLGQLAELGVEVITVRATEQAQACGIFFDACEQLGGHSGPMRHYDVTLRIDDNQHRADQVGEKALKALPPDGRLSGAILRPVGGATLEFSVQVPVAGSRTGRTSGP